MLFITRSSCSTDFDSSPRHRPLTPAQLSNLHDDMAFFNPAPPLPPAKSQTSQRQNENDLDDFLSSDLELSFASTMSLNSPSASRAPSPMAMDISPALPQKSQTHLVPPQPRHFGREMLNAPASIKSTGSTSSHRGRQRAALPAQWMMPGNPPSKGESSLSQGIFDVVCSLHQFYCVKLTIMVARVTHSSVSR